MSKSKWAKYDSQIDNYNTDDVDDIGYNGIARDILGDTDDYRDIDLFRTYIKRYMKRKDVNDYSIRTNNEGYTERVGDEDLPMSLNEYCKKYKIDPKTVKSWKFVNHQGQKAYNIVSYSGNETKEIEVDWGEVKREIENELSNIDYTPNTIKTNNEKTGVLKIADLHLGAYVDDLIISRSYSINHLVDYFKTTVDVINSLNYKKVHVHILGDLIESFTGLNHMNSWKNLGKGMHGAEAVKLVTKILHECLLSRINNLGEIKLVAGNHDRVTSKNDEDVHGDAANLVAWGLELIGYSVEFNSMVITHKVDGIAHILTHGHLGISRMSTKELIWDYGVKGYFNYVSEGHLHSRIQKLSSTQRKKFQVVKDDAVDHKRHVVPSFFTGNFYSESNGWTTTPGFIVIEDNGKGLPNTFDYSL